MTCPSCQQDDTVLWAHNSAISTHHWGDKPESECSCDPKPICAICDLELLVQHGFVVLDAAYFMHASDTLQ